MKRLVGGRFSERELSPLIAQALLHLADAPWLADSPLVHLPGVQRRCQGSTRLFAEGHALAAYLRETVSSLVERLDGDGKEGVLRAVLEGVCAGKSIAAIAREHGKTREHYSRSYWPLAVQLVVADIAALEDVRHLPYTGRTVRKPSR